MSTEAFAQSWNPCLGKRLVSGKKCSFLAEDVEVTNLHLLEVVLEFEKSSLVKAISWEQTSDYSLAVRDVAEVQGNLPEMCAEDDSVLSTALGLRHTAVDLYEKETGDLAAAVFHFEEYCFIVAIGTYEWNVERQEAVFQEFWNDDLFLWTQEQFSKALNVHPLKRVARLEESGSYARRI